MSCLWQSSKIPGFCHKKDIMMGLSCLESKIRYRCSSPYNCMAVTEHRCPNDLRVLACYKPDMIETCIKLSLQICYLFMYCSCVFFFFSNYISFYIQDILFLQLQRV